MAKKQTRRTVSFQRQFYDAAMEYSKSINQSISEYLTRLAHADMAAKGANPPLLGPFVSPNGHYRSPDRPGPQVKLVTKPDQDGEDKYRAALEFQRRNLAKQPKPPEPEPEVKKDNECWWCGDHFRPGQIPVEVDGVKLHGKCQREIKRTPGITIGPR